MIKTNEVPQERVDFYLSNEGRLGIFADAIGAALTAREAEVVAGLERNPQDLSLINNFREIKEAGNCGLMLWRAAYDVNGISYGEYRVPDSVDDREFGRVSARYVTEAAWFEKGTTIWLPLWNGYRNHFETQTVNAPNALLYERYRIEGQAYDPRSMSDILEGYKTVIKLGEMLHTAGILEVPTEPAAAALASEL